VREEDLNILPIAIKTSSEAHDTTYATDVQEKRSIISLDLHSSYISKNNASEHVGVSIGMMGIKAAFAFTYTGHRSGK
jgi:hypothetical protein